MAETRVVHCEGDRTSHADWVYIGRPSPWGNPFNISANRTRAQVITDFDAWVHRSNDPKAQYIRENVHKLKGKTLACWCAPQACHGDVLKQMADCN